MIEVCLIQLLYYEATNELYECPGNECMSYGSDTCWMREKDEKGADYLH